jgi:signal-transduction protein with cAMP-binding, CBS, and nucleotidyltransferase domain
VFNQENSCSLDIKRKQLFPVKQGVNVRGIFHSPNEEKLGQQRLDLFGKKRMVPDERTPKYVSLHRRSYLIGGTFQ